MPYYNKFLWRIPCREITQKFFFSDFLLCHRVASLHKFATISNPSGPIPTIPCTSELRQMDVLIYLQGILADLVVADLNPDCAPPPNPPSLSAPASLEPVFKKINRKQPQTLWFVNSCTVAQGQSLTFTKALHSHSIASQVIVLLMYSIFFSYAYF